MINREKPPLARILPYLGVSQWRQHGKITKMTLKQKRMLAALVMAGVLFTAARVDAATIGGAGDLDKRGEFGGHTHDRTYYASTPSFCIDGDSGSAAGIICPTP